MNVPMDGLQKFLYYFAVGEAFLRPILYLVLVVLGCVLIAYVLKRSAHLSKRATCTHVHHETVHHPVSPSDAPRMDVRREPTIEELENTDI